MKRPKVCDACKGCELLVDEKCTAETQPNLCYCWVEPDEKPLPEKDPFSDVRHSISYIGCGDGSTIVVEDGKETRFPPPPGWVPPMVRFQNGIS